MQSQSLELISNYLVLKMNISSFLSLYKMTCKEHSHNNKEKRVLNYCRDFWGWVLVFLSFFFFFSEPVLNLFLQELSLLYYHLRRSFHWDLLKNTSPIIWDCKLSWSSAVSAIVYRHFRYLKLKVFVGGPSLLGVTLNKRVERRNNHRCSQASISSALIGESVAFVAQAESIRELG